MLVLEINRIGNQVLFRYVIIIYRNLLELNLNASLVFNVFKNLPLFVF